MISKAVAVDCPPARPSWGGCGVRAGEPCVWPASGKPRGAPIPFAPKPPKTPQEP